MSLRLSRISNCILIHVGDLGIGFYHPEKQKSHLSHLNDFLLEKNIQMLVCRGNHDDPAFFKDSHPINGEHSNIRLVEDYTYLTINGKSFLFVGGAISIDRAYPHRIEGRTYWKDEPFRLHDDYPNLPKCDVLITHSAPSGLFPCDGMANIQGFFEDDPNLKGELVSERCNIRLVFDAVQPKAIAYGHFHKSNFEVVDGCKVKCLNINEIWELTI